MYRICIVTRKMVMGGVERTLLSFLDALKCARQDVSVDLCLQYAGGDLYDQIPQWVQVRIMHSVSKKEAILHPKQAFQKLVCLAKGKLFHKSYAEQCLLCSRVYSSLPGEYDVAISYHAPNTVPVFFTMDHVKAKKKILWLHGTMEENNGTDKALLQYHAKYDKIICVSKTVYDSFLSLHPTMKEKTLLRYNLINGDSIRRMAKLGKRFSTAERPVLLTIGRLSHQKGLDLAIEACSRLIKQGYSFKWYVCGEGDERESLEEMIRKKKLDDTFILLGNQENPYGYLNTCDLYVQTSRYEGYCTATAEAKILGKPVITTEVSGAHEQFDDNITGWIVPISAEELFKKISWCLDHWEEAEKIGGKLRWEGLPGERQFDFLWGDL